MIRLIVMRQFIIFNNRKEEEHIDPKIKEGLLKIKKLDKVLGRKLQREKRVKRDRIVLQHKSVNTQHLRYAKQLQ